MVILTLLEPKTNQPHRLWKFTSQFVIRVGRSQDNDIVLEGYFQVSRKHLQIRLLDRKWQLTSSGSNGTFVNNVRVNKAVLQDRDLIRLAENGPLFVFESKSPDKPDNPELPDESESNEKIDCDHEGNPPDSIFCRHCGDPLVDEEYFIGPYQILRTLGRGGMGTTYLVWDKNKTIQGAPLLLVLKEMNAQMNRIPKARELFDREARILKSLNHPNIPKYYDFFVENHRKYLVMELIHGHNLEQFINQRGPLDMTRALRWMIQVCGVLDYLHKLEPPLIHRDIKPANLLLRNIDSRLMVLDFGAVKELGTSLATRIGVEGYSSPEQYRGKPCPQSDLYGVGTSLIFLLTGKKPMEFYRYQNFKHDFDMKLIPNISSKLQMVLTKTCHRNPEDRYNNAKALSKALASCLPMNK